MMMLKQVSVNRIEIPEHGSGSELFFFSFEQQQAKFNENEIKQIIEQQTK
jgi:hypothetical protein